MPKYTNTTKGVLDFVVGGTPEEPKFESFKAGQTKNVSLNLDHPAVIGALTTGALTTDDKTVLKELEARDRASKSGAKGEDLPSVS